MITEILRKAISETATGLGIESPVINLEHPSDSAHGDYSCNVAMMAAKQLGKNPRKLAQEIVDILNGQEIQYVDRAEVAGPGFINFFLVRDFFTEQLDEILAKSDDFGKGDSLTGKTVLVEFTDPNPFKPLHIGHLMSNTIGESISRIVEFGGANVLRATYQGDVGLHVAKALWGLEHIDEEFPADSAPLTEKAEYLGRAYVIGATAFKDDETAAKEVHQINKEVYQGLEGDRKNIYDTGRAWSLEAFEKYYKILGTDFDTYFFESESTPKGLQAVKDNTPGIFEESDGAIVFKGEKYDEKLHTRVFVNFLGLPTYEAKDLGLSQIKKERLDFDQSIIITANEQSEYFKVMFKALEQVFPEDASITRHVDHGMMVLPTGKMGSRTGNVVTGESLINDAIAGSKAMMKEGFEGDVEGVATDVGVAALKYQILRQTPGKNIVFDPEQALSYEGETGPYLQYAVVRAQTLLRKASEQGKQPAMTDRPDEVLDLERLLYQLPERAQRALDEYEPQHIAGYSQEVAQAFSTFYGNTKVLVDDNPHVGYHLALVEATVHVLSNCLYILGIRVPEKM